MKTNQEIKWSEKKVRLKTLIAIVLASALLTSLLTYFAFSLGIRNIAKQEDSMRGVVFEKNQQAWFEPQTLISYKDKLILGIGGGSGFAGVWQTTDGVTWTKVYEKAPSDWWSSQIFNGKLYLGGGYGEPFAQITEYDGVTFREVFRQTGGLGGGQGCVEALGIHNDYIYAGRKNEIWRSADGHVWSKVFSFATNKGIYQFGEDAGGFLAFEGEPISAPSKVYFTTNGTDWTVWATTQDVEWYRSHSPSDRIRLGQWLFIGDGKGDVLIRKNDIWNSQFLRIFNSEGSNVVAMKVKRIGNYLGISSGSGTGYKGKGTFSVWDGNTLRLVAELPMSILDFELYKGSIYLACIGIVKDDWSTDSSANQISVIRLPENTIKESKTFPTTIRLFENRAINTNGFSAGFIPILGYEKVFVSIYSNQTGTLDLQAYDDISNEWRNVESVSISAGILTFEEVIWRTKFLRVFFTPTAIASVSIWVSLT